MADIDPFQEFDTLTKDPFQEFDQMTTGQDPFQEFDKLTAPTQQPAQNKQSLQDVLNGTAALAPPNPNDDWTVAGEFSRAVVTGMSDMINSVGELPMDIGLADEALFDVKPFTGRPQTAGGEFAAAAVQFLVPYTGVLKGVTWASRLAKASKMVKNIDHANDVLKPIQVSKKAQMAKAAGAGAVADFVAFSPNDPNLSAVLREHAELQDPVTELLASDPNDPAVLNRFRNTVEGLGLGISADVILHMLGRGVKYAGEGAADYVRRTPALHEKVDGVMSKIDAARERLSYAAGRLEQEVFFSGKGFKELDRIQRKIKKAEERPDGALSLEEEARALESAGEVVHNFLTNGTVRITDRAIEKTGEGFNSILEYARKSADEVGVNQDQFVADFYDYIKYNRARARRKYYEGRSKGTDEDAISGGIPREEVSTQLDRIENSSHFGQIQQVVDRYKGFHNRLLDFMEDSGMLDASTRKVLWDSSDGMLAPFYRDVDKVTPTKRRPGLKARRDPLHAKAKVITEREARELPPIKDMEENVLKYVSDSINAAMLNRFKALAYKTAMAIQESSPDYEDMFISKPEKLPKAKVIKGSDVAKRLQHILDGEEIDQNLFEQLQDEIFTFYSSQNKNLPNLDTVFIDGKPVAYNVEDPMLFRSMSTLGPKAVGDWGKFIIKVGHPFKMGLTRLVTMDPGFFAGANIVRDPFIAVIQSKGGISMRDIYKLGFGNVFKNAEFEEYLLNGASLGRAAYGESADAGIKGVYEQNLKKLGLNMDKSIVVAGNKRQVRTALKRYSNHVMDFISKFEHASRMSEYQKLLQQGYSKRRAALMARTVTTDFGQRGASQIYRNLAAITPFLNASLQGLHKFGNTIDIRKTHKVLKAMQEGKTYHEVGMSLNDWKDGANAYRRIMGYLVLPYTAVWAFNNFTDPERKAAYYDTPEEIRTLNTVIPLYKDEQGDWVRVIIPKPFEYSMFINGLEKTADELMNKNERNILGEYLMSSLLRSSHIEGNSAIPLFLRVPKELAMDEKFSGMPISGNLQKTIPQDRYRANTSETAVALSRAIHDNFMDADVYRKAEIAGARGVAAIGEVLSLGQLGALSDHDYSPVAIEHVVNSYFGTIGRMGLEWFSDPLFREAMQMAPEAARQPLQDPKNMGPLVAWTRRFIRQGPLTSTSDTKLFYDRKKKAEQLNTFKNKVMYGLNEMDSQDFEKMLKDPDNRVLVEQWPLLMAHGRRIAEINSMIKDIGKMGDRTPQQILTEQNVLLRQRNDLTKQINELFTENRNMILDQAAQEGD